MATDLISEKTRKEFREYFVEKRTLREIEKEFDAADVPLDKNYQPQVSGQRRSLIEQYYHSIDWTKWSDVEKILIVYEGILNQLEGQIDVSDNAKKTYKLLRKWLEKDGFQHRKGKLQRVDKSLNLSEIADHATEFDIPELLKQIDRMKSAVEKDPELAIGTAKELIETTCKTILSDCDIEFYENEEITKLVKKTRKTLGLVPESIPSSAKGAQIIQRLLSNLGAIAQGISELRNLYGTGHGKHGKTKGLTARHAKLVVGISAALTVFLLETHEERRL